MIKPSPKHMYMHQESMTDSYTAYLNRAGTSSKKIVIHTQCIVTLFSYFLTHFQTLYSHNLIILSTETESLGIGV